MTANIGTGTVLITSPTSEPGPARFPEVGKRA